MGFMIVDILFLAESNWNLTKSFGMHYFLTPSKSQPHLLINLSIAFSVAPEFSIDSMVLTETASFKSYKVESQQKSEVLNMSVRAPSGLLIG